MEAGLRKVKKRARARIEGTKDFVFKGSMDVSPDANKPSKEMCSATVSMTKGDASNDEAPRTTVYLTMKDEESAISAQKLFQEIVNDPELPMPLKVACRQEGSVCIFTVDA